MTYKLDIEVNSNFTVIEGHQIIERLGGTIKG